MNPTVTIAAAGRTHIGLVRRRNEDSFYVGRHLVAVADGLGGYAGGDVASALAVDAMREFDREVARAALLATLGSAVAVANGALRRRLAADPGLRSMGTTLVALLWSGTSAALAHIGDSRAYRHREGRLTQLTEDHTFDHLVSGAGRMPTLPERISRYLDGKPEGKSADITSHELRIGDRWLLCSDGLSSYVAHGDIHEVLASASTAEAPDRLVELALDAGAPDNATVVVIDVEAA